MVIFFWFLLCIVKVVGLMWFGVWGNWKLCVVCFLVVVLLKENLGKLVGRNDGWEVGGVLVLFWVYLNNGLKLFIFLIFFFIIYWIIVIFFVWLNCDMWLMVWFLIDGFYCGLRMWMWCVIFRLLSLNEC